ncbi:MAG: hypothetical protein ABSG05_00295 [Candidatus Pacearchaeota archaeon]|jgi:hypothetical protein
MSLTSKLGLSGAVLAASLAFANPAKAQNPQNLPQPVSGLYLNPFIPYYPADMINQICSEITEYQRQQAQQPQIQTQRPQTHRTTRNTHARKTLTHRTTSRNVVPTRQVPYHINSDSLVRELVRRAQVKVDSIYAERARIADSIAKARYVAPIAPVTSVTHPVQSTGPEFRPSRYARNSVEAGLAALYGTNRELSLEAFVNGEVFRGLRLEGYGNWSAVKENPYDTFNHSDTTQVLRQSLSPGIYKTTNTVINTSRFQRGIAEAGGRILVEPFNWLDLIVGAGARMVKGTQDKNGQETISYETNGVQRDSTYQISHSTENNVTNYLLSLNAGARLNFSGVNLNLNYNKVGKRNIWKAGLGFTF